MVCVCMCVCVVRPEKNGLLCLVGTLHIAVVQRLCIHIIVIIVVVVVAALLAQVSLGGGRRLLDCKCAKPQGYLVL